MKRTSPLEEVLPASSQDRVRDIRSSKYKAVLSGSDKSKDREDNGMIDPGGIDLNPIDRTLALNSQGSGFKYNMDPAMLERYRLAPGFTPVILNVRSLDSLPKFLGIHEGVLSAH